MAAEHVDHAKIVPLQLLRPARNQRAGAGLQRIQQQPRQKEIVGHVAAPRNLGVGLLGIRRVNLRQEHGPLSRRHAAQPIQHLPGLRLVEEVAPARNLGSVCKCVQPDDLCAVGGELLQYLLVKRPDERRIYV
ncbi:hypothetical protein SDC9_147491 [bioreactor metagenome]|uniref:Uncharacterized protein n=1 Tax=bioreactor metagenome TaxID=1076179 RepID=A0A645EEU6_9ZZZZ